MLKVLNFFFKSSWRQILIIALFSIISAGLNVLSLNYLKEIVSASADQRVYYLGIVALLILAAATVSLLIERYSTRYFEAKLVKYREEIAEQLLHTKYESIEKKLPRLAPILMVEINEVSDFGKLIPAFIVALVQIVAIMGYLVFLSWRLSLIVLVLFAVVISLMFLVLPRVKKLKDKRSKTRFRLYTMFDLMNSGFKDLIISRKHGMSYVANSIRPPSMETAKHNGNIHMLKVGMEQVINAMLILGFGIALILYLNWIQAGKDVGVQFMALLLFILPSFIRVVDFFNQLKNAENSLDQINSLNADISQDIIITDKQVAYETGKKGPLISLENVNYSYAQSEHGFKLGPIDLEINENEITIINGGNGSGKTTLFNLLAGLYTPQTGSLIFQDQIINDDNIRSFRDRFSCYFTNSPVFDDLTYVGEENLERGQFYIKELELEGKTNISTNAIAQTSLSFGQRGRLNLLRLLLEDRSIYMFDEWAANQDVHFKNKFYTEIIPNLKKRGKTIILISHDDRYYEIADKIVSMRNGSIESIRKPIPEKRLS